ncbi:MAG: UDP-N-acetylmuramoyl-tripeptide--D-alanyl-D-alanine ligase [Firmicutes bacterium]|nr:UDP-N-acetylmuramoyl-tripeptide--D-alanyl-D-alanine ligase [Bacillota bacterium]
MRFSARDVERACAGRLLSGDPAIVFSGVATDSRQALPGDLFFALKGERRDGHEFVGDALRAGAAGAVVSRPVTVPAAHGGAYAIIQVEDALKALGMLAAEHRSRFGGLVVGVTGSVGKTSTKEMIASVLSTRFSVLKPEGNMNTEIGVPLTAFRLSGEYDAAVFELAMRLRGEIAWLAGIVRPRIGVITNISETHLERLGTRENIALAKAELLEALPPDGCAVLNGDNEWIRKVSARANCDRVFYGMGTGSDVSATDVSVSIEGTRFTLRSPAGAAECFIPVPGEHHVYNALAAACVGLRADLSLDEVREGLAAFKPAGMRTEIRSARGVTVINDAYNASPVSTRAALAVLATVAGGRRVAVLGNMLELGDYTVEGHRETGRAVRSMGIDALVAVGSLAGDTAMGALEAGMPPEDVRWCSSNRDAVSILKSMLKPGDTVLVKGSRGARMEEVVNGLLEG